MESVSFSETVEQLIGELNCLRPQSIRRANGFLPYDYGIPGGYYVELWDWDGFFIALHMVGRTPAQPEYLKYWALNFIAAADESGYAPGCITPDGPEPGHRSFQMKPLIAQGAELAARMMDDYGWIEDNYEALVKMVRRREKTHVDARYGLFCWDHAMQSGADNNPAIGNDEVDHKQVVSCDINAFIWREYLALERLAAKLGRPEDEAHFHNKAAELQAALEEHLWCEEEESYLNINRRTGAFIKCVSYSNFVPLWATMVKQNRAERMIRRYAWNEAHLLSDHGLRTLSKQDPNYNNRNIIWPYSNWQGPVWPIANYFYFVGLMNYGFATQAKDLLERVARLCLGDIKTFGAMHENYCAETGAPLAPSGDQSPKGEQEAGFIGWNLLLQDMAEMLAGKPNLLGQP